MLKINTSILTPGMVLAKPIYDAQGKLLIDRNIKLKKLYIDKLIQYKIETVYISWDKENLSGVSEMITEETKLQTLKVIKETVNSISITKHIDLRKLETVITDIIGEFMSDKGILLNLTDIRSIDDYTFGHSVNVCILSLIMGIALNYDKESLKVLGVGALLHDIGKVQISSDILNKPGILTDMEYEEIKKHSFFGYGMVKNIEGIKKEIAWIIRDHHERYDGNGYPNGLWGQNIHVFSRIVAICDVYDALTSNRIYRSGIPPHQAIEYLIAMGNHQFDYNLVKIFLRHICIYPIGTMVKLQSGEQGVVVELDEYHPTRPIIDIVRDMNGRSLETKIRVDLRKNLKNGIVSILEAV